MPDKTQLEKAFEECGEQLDRIADALKREKPTDPNYPRTLATNFDESVPKQFIVLGPSEIQVIHSGSFDGEELWNLTNGVLSYCENHDGVPTDSVCSFDLTTFEITELDLGYNSHWITN